MSSSVVISICGSWVSIEPHVVAASRVVVDILSSPRFLKVCCSLPLCLIELSRTPKRILDESPAMFWRHHIANVLVPDDGATEQMRQDGRGNQLPQVSEPSKETGPGIIHILDVVFVESS